MKANTPPMEALQGQKKLYAKGCFKKISYVLENMIYFFSFLGGKSNHVFIACLWVFFPQCFSSIWEVWNHDFIVKYI